MKKLLLSIALILIISPSFAQDWAEEMTNPNANFYDVQNNFNLYWSTRDINEPGNGYKPFKRWESFMAPRVYPSGDMTLTGQTWKNYEAYLQTEAAQKINSPHTVMSSTWTAVGPMGAMTGVADNGFPRKAGRDNFITFHPTVSTTFWVGAPAGGLWKTTNSGTNWTTNTDLLSITGCSDLAIDPSNTQTMYLATGDGDAGDTPSIGVLKSTDGGATWLVTGTVWAQSLGRRIRRLIINPNNPQTLFAATNAGIYRTTNGGTNWTQLNSTVSFYDIEFNPGNPNTIYAAGTTFYKSTNGGTSFSSAGVTGLPAAANLSRMAIAVTANDTNYVYILASKNSTNGYAFDGVFRSTNSGVAFTTMSTTPDILSNPCAGTGGSAQGWYDLAFGANPLNKNDISVGGINVWRSTNGGTTWTSIGCWIGTGSPPYIHADHHCLSYNSAGTIYSANDGGIFVYTGTAWTDITSTRNIAQIYKIGLSGLSSNLFITGHQDNGTNIYNAGTYSASRAGDGMDCFIDRTNNSIMYSATPNGAYKKSTNGGLSWTTCTTGLSGTASWVSPWKQDPTTAATLYAGYTQMFKSTNSAGAWTALTAITGSGGIVEFAIAPSNNQVLYVIKGTGLYRSINGGTSWTTITGTVPTGTAAPTFFTISPTDENTAWITLSGFSAVNKVFKTVDGGANWTNVTYNLPNIPANCSVYHTGSANDGMYVGMDAGIYYTDNTMSTWINYSVGMPNTPVMDMEIYAGTMKLRAATYGRGVWEVDAYTSPTAAPTSAFTISTVNKCASAPVSFVDQSTNTPNAWAWSFQSGTPATSTIQNPSATFPAAGSYTVSLTATNAFGLGTTTTQTVVILPVPSVTITASQTNICSGTAVTYTATGAATYVWSGAGGAAATAAYTPLFSQTYSVTGSDGTCTSVKTVSVTVVTTPVVSVNVTPQIVCVGTAVTYTASGATTYTWTTGGGTSAVATFTPSASGSYSVTGTTNGCSAVKTTSVTVNNLPSVSITPVAGVLCDNGSPQPLAGTPGGGTFSGTGVTGSNFDPTIGAGVYQVYYNYTDGNNCSNIDSTAVTVQSCVGIAKNTNTNELIVYPNPAANEFFVKIIGATGNASAELMDVLGNLIQKRQSEATGTNTIIKFNLTGVSEGVYFVRVKHNGKTQVVRLIHQ